MPIKKTLSTKQVFSYANSAGSVTLSFELSDDKRQVGDFLELLGEAIKDVKKLEKSIK